MAKEREFVFTPVASYHLFTHHLFVYHLIYQIRKLKFSRNGYQIDTNELSNKNLDQLSIDNSFV